MNPEQGPPRGNQGVTLWHSSNSDEWERQDALARREQAGFTSDNRIARVGAFIRRTSIDELPQLSNVLRTEMSLVGPRPYTLGSQVGERLFWEVDDYWLRHSLKPGLTGLAQVRGHRGATETEALLIERLDADLEYLRDWSLWGDLKIVVATARVLVHPNAN